MKRIFRQLTALGILLCFVSGCAAIDLAGSGAAEKINWNEYLDC
jgi:hypothetical protein